MKVLVTGAGAVLGQGIIRSLRRSLLAPRIVAVDPSPLAAGLYWADSSHLVPMAADPAYGDRVRKILQDERPDAVLIGTDVELAYFARERAALERDFSTRVVISDPDVIAIADDKWLTFEFLRKHGFDRPDSTIHGDANDLVKRVGFPLIVKPRRGARSVGVSQIPDQVALSRAVEGRQDLIIQECVGSAENEYTAGLICFHGKCAASITMRRDLRDGNTYRAFPIPGFEHDAILRRIAETLNPHGPVNFQFRLDGGKVKIFEINGRFSGTTPLRALANFPEVEMVLRHLVLGEPIVQPEIKPVVILRHWSETVIDGARLLVDPR